MLEFTAKQRNNHYQGQPCIYMLSPCKLSSPGWGTPTAAVRMNQLPSVSTRVALYLTRRDEWRQFSSKFYLLGAWGKFQVLFLNETFCLPFWLQPLSTAHKIVLWPGRTASFEKSWEHWMGPFPVVARVFGDSYPSPSKSQSRPEAPPGSGARNSSQGVFWYLSVGQWAELCPLQPFLEIPRQT